MGEGYRLDMKTASGWDENETTGPVVGSGVLCLSCNVSNESTLKVFKQAES